MKADRQSIKSARKPAANKKARKTDKKLTKTDKSGQGRRPSKAKSKKRDNCNSNYAETDTETCCLVCGENFSEEWIQCSKCYGWAHTECADVNDPLYYYCDNCA